MSDPKPRNELEYLIQGADLDLVSVGTLYTVLLRTDIWVLTDREWDGRSADPELKTLMMTPKEGGRVLPIWTDPDRTATARQNYPDYPHTAKLMGALMLLNLSQDGAGLAINPGDAFQMHLSPEGIGQLRQAFGPFVTAR